MIAVAATGQLGTRAYFSNYSPFVATFAPGEGVACPGAENTWRIDDGTSFGRFNRAPLPRHQAAALAAYFRAVPSRWRDQLIRPANVNKLIQLFARRFAIDGVNVNPEARRRVIWNGQVGEHSCLLEYGSNKPWAQACPIIQDNFENESVNPGQSVEPCDAGQNGNSARRRRQFGGGGGSCPHTPGDNGPGKNIDWEEGPSAPECGSGDNCGEELCTGYCCDPDPENPHPPDYYDPKDPQNHHGQPPRPAPEPTSTTTGTPPTNTPEPPVEPMFICVGSTIRPGAFDYVNYGHGVYEPGPEFWDKCGFQVEMGGRKFTPRQLDEDDEDNPCSGRCDLVVFKGFLLYELPLVCLS
ncbi:hypothetical protein BDV10DRAFT_199829 [Aspergillus recurvatus]